MATIVHFDISADEPERAKAFYEKLFDWKMEKLPGPMDYYMIATKGIDGAQGIGGGMAKRDAGQQPGIINYIGVLSIDKTLEQVAASGGTVLMPVQPVPGYGLLAICADTEGNMFGVFEEKK